MKRLFYLTSFLLLICSVELRSQNLLDVYQKQIPKKYLTDEYDRATLTYNLIFNSKLNPAINYFYINSISMGSDTTNKGKTDSLRTTYKNVRNHFLRNKYDWAAREVERICKRNDLGSNTGYITSYFDDFLNKDYLLFDTSYIHQKLDILIDQNRMDYILFLFYTKEYNDYDPTIKYAERNKTEEFKIISGYEKTVAEFDLLQPEEKLIAINDIINHWYLLDREKTILKEDEPNFEICDLIYSFYKDEYRVEPALRIFGEYSYKHSLDWSIINTFERALERYTTKFYTFNVKVYFSYKYTLGAGIKIKIRNEKSFLSSINLNFGIMSFTSQVESPDHNKMFSSNYLVFNPSVWNYYRWYISEIKNFSTFSCFVETGFPVYYVSKQISIGLGASLLYYSLKYNFDITEYHWQRTDYGETLPVVSDFNFECNYNKIQFEPYISINSEFELLNITYKYLPIKNLHVFNIGLEYSINNIF
ncbi:MAG: hypothetical protein V1720_00600 [bacterium]